MDWAELEDLRERVVLAGKASAAFLSLARQRDPDKKQVRKYWRPSDTKRSGATGISDWKIIYKLLDRQRPTRIFELGTWFGTSAYAMIYMARALGIDPDIYTCDWNRVLVKLPDYNQKLHFRHCVSCDMLDDMLADDLKVQFGFIDAVFQKDDAKRVCDLFEGKILLAFHDFNTKGGRNIDKVLKVRPDLHVIEPPVFGINSRTAVVEEV